MTYGYFNDETREYIITNPQTPTKWINYIGSLSFGGFVDHLGGSVICKGDPALNRITKYIPQLPDSSFNGETVYIKVKTKDSVKVFSPYYVPTLDPYDYYECKVGLGYNTYITEFYGIRTEITVFVPMGKDVVLKRIKVTNLTSEAAEIDIIPVVEYTHFDALKQFTNADWVPQTMMSKAIYDEQLVLTQYAFMKKENSVNYITSNLKVDSFETDRRRFLRDNQGGSFNKPLSLYEEHLSNYEARRGDNIAALLHKLGPVKPGETVTVTTQLGQYSSYDSSKEQMEYYRDQNNVDQAFIELKEFWGNYLSVMTVETPDKNMNTMLNIHNPKQCYMTKNWSRYLSLYQLGLGARGIGIRDSSQDTMGVISFMPEASKELITTLLSMQRRDGSAYHQYNPKTLIASEGDSNEEEDRPNYYGDDHLWLILATMEYLKETGDYNFLKEKIAFYDKDKQDNPLEYATVEEHVKRALKFTKNDVGQNGLPHLGFADWNDTVNLPAGSESLFNANLYGYGLKLYLELLDYLEQPKTSYEEDYLEMQSIFQNKAWDGKWFIRYIDQNNKPLGSKSNEEGQIFTNGQSWSVISGFADKIQGKVALDSVNRLLNTKKGIKLSYPGFEGYDEVKGGVSSYPPGAKENGGIFLHSNPWVIYAETILGNGDRAFEYYDQINPVKKNDIIDEFETAPYVYPQNILGDEHPEFGLARNCWLSGTASWTYQIATKHILGILPTHMGLKINPCIPSDWEGFKVTRRFRGSLYHISVINGDQISKGVKEIYVNDEKIESTYLPYGEGSYNIKVVMGV